MPVRQTHQCATPAAAIALVGSQSQVLDAGETNSPPAVVWAA